MLRELAPNLWVADKDLRFFGLPVGTRMTVIRLRDGSLFLHSPIALAGGLRAELDALGPVRFLVAPNRFHHLFLAECAAAWPEAEIHAAPGLPEKRRDLAFDALLGAEAPSGWVGEIDQRPVRGAPLLNEVVFLHRPSSTLLLTDLAFHFGEEIPPAARWFFRAVGVYGRFGPSWMEHLLIRDRRVARTDLDHVLAWDFDRVIVSHGSVLESGGREVLREAYRWL